jgi:uncharacterized protein (TIGR02680 family)
MTVTELPAPTSRAPDPPTTRWRPERAGIINLWRYYDETFHFHRGRLLLRGLNGTGKSKALELLLPYLLDANLRPSRLSTFGGQERTMHWNLLGDGYEGHTRVGYVWAEFTRQAEDGVREFFTAGARLQASAGSRSVRALYFTTRQRIGVPGGLQLIGDGARPLTPGGLEEAIGTHGRVFAAAAADYRRNVRHTLFPGMGLEGYEALITALLQLRTPKLSEHLDPGELSTLLSKALPPLDSGAVAEIAEGFEKLDRRREDLARLEDDVAAAGKLADRQRRYAQRVVRAAAAALISATTRMDERTRRARESAQAHAQAVEERRDQDEADARLADEALIQAERKAALEHLDAYKQGRHLDELRARLSEQRNVADRARGAAERAAWHLKEAREQLAGAAGAAARAARAVERSEAEAQQAARRAAVEAAHESAAGEHDLDRARGIVTAAVEARAGQLGEVRVALDAHERAADERDRTESRLEATTAELEEAARTVTDRRRGHARAVARLAEDLRAWALGCRLLDLHRVGDELAVRAEHETAVLALVGEAATDAERALASQETTLAAEQRQLEDRRAALAGELEALRATRHVEPDPPATRTAARTGRAGAPLWRLVDFAPHTDAATQAAVEAALEDAGLLDAWVRPDGTVEPTGGKHDRFAGAALVAPAPSTSLADVLVREPDAPVPAALVDRLLRSVAFGDTAPDHPAGVGADGGWRLGSLAGSWSKPEPAFIGSSARERVRQRRIAGVERELAAVDTERARVEAALADCTARRAGLAEEQQRRPGHDAVRQARSALERAEAEHAARADATARARHDRDAADEAAVKALRRLAALASTHGLPTERAAVDAVADALRSYDRSAAAWLDDRRRLEGAGTRRADAEAATARHEAHADDAAQAAEAAERDVRRLRVRLDTLEAEVGGEYRAILDEVAGLRERLAAIDGERRVLTQRLRSLEGRIGELRLALQRDEEDRDKAVAARDDAAEGFRRLDSLGLLADAGCTSEGLEGVRATLDAARGAADALASVTFEPQHLRAAESTLHETVHALSQTLAGRADLSLEPDEASGVWLLLATADGVRLGATTLHASLVAERDAAKAELTDYEEELFDQTLTGSARRQVADRIRRAKALVEVMDRLLSRVQTASRMRVRLRWDVDPALPPGTKEARELLLRRAVGDDDRQALHAFFRARIDEVRETDAAAGWEEQLLQVLDYRTWHRFVVHIERDGEVHAVTKRTHGRLSGGERAIALHLPLFAAVAAHYAATPGAPRLILLDEVFVGVDSANRGQLLDLIVRLDLDAVLTSDHEWCTYTELDGIAVHQLVTGTDGDDAVTSARFVWDGARLLPTSGEQLSYETDDG